ncbi:hypothetical protein AAG906_023446 [Vitis piasezkii]
MEANRKRRGFMKGKLAMPFYRVAKPSSTVQYSSKVKPSQTSPLAPSVGFVVDQEYVIPQPKQKVAFIIPAENGRDSLFGTYGAGGDEGVDAKAANYISVVQERFKLDRVNSKKS